ncbi:MAG: N-acetylneuraminate synthase family protein [Nitrososphaerales archaeon]|nr:N-acetylneuraminate synthase family protein [Nitrososphaerales archaeon]|tara:strand:- start:747 stop:3140 length:2394 start_codon:yes stop_codon:yes gene_type:complete
MDTSKSAIIVLGAGPVGLIVAWELLKQGREVIIFERNDRVGGMCRTWEWDDFLVDTGPHIFHTPDQYLASFWEKEFGDLFVKGEFWCKNVAGKNFDEYWDYPLSWESISRYPPSLKARILEELRTMDFEKKVTAKTYSEYIEAQVGPILTKMFFKTYPEKIWGISTDEMTPDWAPKRVEFRNKVTPFYHRQWNAVGKYGTGCIYERIKDNILELGGELCFGYEVESILHKGNTITDIKFSSGEKIRVGRDNIIISSLPITLTSKLLGYKSDLTFRGIRSVYVAYNEKEILPEGIHWLYYGSEHIYFNRITEPKKLTPFVAPDNKTYLTAEITFSKGDEIDLMNSENLIDEVSKQVERVGLVKKKKLLNASTNKEYFVYPVFYRGYQQDLAKTRSTISRFQQLYSIGTGGDYNYADSQILFHKAFDTVSIICGKDSSYTQVIRKTTPATLNPTVTINGRNIGAGERAYIIAEAGLNHNGSLKLAKKLVDAAKKTGCDAIKFQTYKPHSRISSQVKAVKYAETIIGLEETLYEMFERLAMPFEQQEELFVYAKKQGIEIFSTPFDFESVDFLEKIGVKFFKIASFDLVNLPLIKYVAKTGKPMIISTGMSTLGQIEEAVDTISREDNQNLMLLHCNSSYPASPDEMNLNVIPNLQKNFNIPVGLSDHTFGLFVSHTAIVMGANLIERHFTLDRTFEGPDHILSSEPKELSDLVSISKQVPIIMGDGIKRIQPNEYDTINTQRKSIYAAMDIKRGAIITEDMIVIKGPGGGLLPKFKEVVIGRRARKNIEEDYPITWENV